MDIYQVKYIVMKMNTTENVNLAKVKEHLSAYVTMAARGKTVVVCRRNKPVAKLVGTEELPARNRTRLGSAPGSVVIKGDVTAPAMDAKDWDVLG